MLLAYYASEAGVTGAKGKRRVSIELTMAKGQRRPDAGNLRKLFDDCCKHAGLIIDDGPKWFSGPEPTFAAQRSEDWGTLITIENLT
jgi:Holliday junction resolvase RusA-like endonuclease